MLARSKQICQHCLFWSPWVWQGSLLSQSNRCWNYIFSMSVDFRGGKTPNLFTDFIDRHPIRGKPSEYSMLSGGPYNQDRRWLKPWLNLTGFQISSALKNALKLCGFSVLATTVARDARASRETDELVMCGCCFCYFTRLFVMNQLGFASRC